MNSYDYTMSNDTSIVMEVFIKVTVVLATYLEEDNVLLRVSQLCYVLSHVMFCNGCLMHGLHS